MANAGQLGLAVGTGTAAISLPLAETPAGDAGLLASLSLLQASTFQFVAGRLLQTAGASWLSSLGNQQPAVATAANLMQDMTEEPAPSISPVSPLSDSFDAMAGTSSCQRN
jgi:hypothetical protein